MSEFMGLVTGTYEAKVRVFVYIKLLVICQNTLTLCTLW